MSEERIVTPTGFLRVLISLDKNLENEELAFTFSAIEITQPDLFPSAAKRIPVNIGQRQIRRQFHGLIGGIKRSDIKSLLIDERRQ